MRKLTKSELFVELNNASRRAMLAERKLAAIDRQALEILLREHHWHQDNCPCDPQATEGRYLQHLTDQLLALIGGEK